MKTKAKKIVQETYSARISSKGQFVVPKAIRDEMAFNSGTTIYLNVLRDKKTNQIKDLKLKREMSIVELAESGHFPQPRKNKGVSPLEARKYMEKNYERY